MNESTAQLAHENLELRSDAERLEIENADLRQQRTEGGRLMPSYIVHDGVGGFALSNAPQPTLQELLDEARREGLEEAASVCDRRADALDQDADNQFTPVTLSIRWHHTASMLRAAADEIRALLLEEETT